MWDVHILFNSNSLSQLDFLKKKILNLFNLSRNSRKVRFINFNRETWI